MAGKLDESAVTFWEQDINGWFLLLLLCCVLIVLCVVFWWFFNSRGALLADQSKELAEVRVDVEKAQSAVEAGEKKNELLQTAAERLEREKGDMARQMEQYRKIDEEREEMQQLLGEYDEKLQLANRCLQSLEKEMDQERSTTELREKEYADLQDEKVKADAALAELQQTVADLQAQLQLTLQSPDQIDRRDEMHEPLSRPRELTEAAVVGASRPGTALTKASEGSPAGVGGGGGGDVRVGYDGGGAEEHLPEEEAYFTMPEPQLRQEVLGMRERLREREEEFGGLEKRLEELMEQHAHAQGELMQERTRNEGLQSHIKFYETRLTILHQLQNMVGESHSLLNTFVQSSTHLQGELEKEREDNRQMRRELDQERLRVQLLLQILRHFKTKLLEMSPDLQLLGNNLSSSGFSYGSNRAAAALKDSPERSSPPQSPHFPSSEHSPDEPYQYCPSPRSAHLTSMMPIPPPKRNGGARSVPFQCCAGASGADHLDISFKMPQPYAPCPDRMTQPLYPNPIPTQAWAKKNGAFTGRRSPPVSARRSAR
ncbi:unnamed protein product [Vitrella brassicaformis CCMP3155]|uniref:Uncharacterized protein n=1 Tax=Vitrella brassicaformis (strain CCMP3155) TaxID=1169540 RepID=A0A0G4GRY4_VITBC|nr:unnamed protein product [Vitrella brassicaformis CCMP3155]|eukprot:CEM33374.1 unnamed protein product [Vitrella brassicaformis CCMP3155]